MELTTTSNIKVVTAPESKINSVDFENLTFGNVFTDHMLVCDYHDGVWEQPVIQPYEPFTMDPSSRVFHYGQAIFEGMKAYKDANDDVWLFRPIRISSVLTNLLFVWPCPKCRKRFS